MNEMIERCVDAMIARRVLPDGCEINRNALRADVRAVLLAARDPTKEMIEIGNTAIDDGLDTTQDSYSEYTLPATCARAVFAAMIDEACR